MPKTMIWLATVIRVAIAPVLVGALGLLLESPQSASDLAAAAGLLLLGTIHVLYWWRPWPSRQRRAVVAVASMIVINFVLLNLLGLAEPLLWLYPALIAGAGLHVRAAAIGVGLTALAAAAPIALEGSLIHPVDAIQATDALGPSHSILLSIVLAGLGMTAVRQLISLNAELHATQAALADLAVASERERLAHELHDLLGRTLSLIAVKAELASRLSGKGDPSADAELADVQRLARQAVRDVREAVTGAHTPSVDAELAAAEA
ncbi:MAG: histidine kinase, partial [Chloroflexota bacterium]|nr:histidine kinase [Chloroflexota bacterium]